MHSKALWTDIMAYDLRRDATRRLTGSVLTGGDPDGAILTEAILTRVIWTP